MSLIDKSFTPATHAAYQQGLVAFQDFCSIHGISSQLPTTEQNVARFVAYMSLSGKAAATAKNYLAGLSAYHKINSLPDPTNTFLIRTLLRGLTRSSAKGDNRYPITLERLQALLPTLSLVCKDTYEACLFKAAFSLAFFGFLRVSEMLGQTSTGGSRRGPLQLKDVSIDLVSLSVKLSGSKTNQTGRPEMVIIHKEFKNQEFCPINLMEKYVQAHPKNSNTLFVHFNGSPVTRYQFQAVLKKSAHCLKWQVSGFTSHSFRIGAATSAAAKGVPVEEIMRKGRWKSAAVASYIRLDRV